MIRFFHAPEPIPATATLSVEESLRPYVVISVDAPKCEQFKPSFCTVHPNASLPAIADGDATMFESNAILLYRIEKTGRYLSENAPDAR